MTRAEEALEFLLYHGQPDGAHHKAWVIDQAVRILTGCPMETYRGRDTRGTEYTYKALGVCTGYLAAIACAKDGEDGPESYSWDEGTPP